MPLSQPRPLTESLATLRAAADTAESAFLASLVPTFADRWAFYRALDDGLPVDATSPACIAAHDAWIDALHRFYRARDGERGVLGSRGL